MSGPGRRSILARSLRAVAIAAIALVLAAVLAARLGVTLPLDRFRAQAERAASRALGLGVHVEGNLEAEIGFTLGLLVERLRIDNPSGWDGSLLELEHAHVKISLWALLRRELHLRELAAQDALLALEERADGVSNWPSRRSAGTDTGTEDDPKSQAGNPPRGRFALVGFDRLSLERLEVTRVRPETPARSFRLESLTGSGPPGDPVVVEAAGRLGPEAFSLQIATDSIRDAGDLSRPWSAAVDLAIAHTRVELAGRFGFDRAKPGAAGARAVVLPSGRRAPDLRLHVEGRRLDDLDRLTGVDLPPLGPFEVDGRFGLTADGFDVTDARLRLGDSTLSGRAHYAGGERPALDVRLDSPLLQLDDFRTGGWSAFAPGAGQASERADARERSSASERAAGSGPPTALLARDNLGRANVDLEVVVQQVRSGKDVLGRGELRATARDARARVELELAVPGGSFEGTLRVEPAGEDFDTRLVLRSDRFDYGVLARRIDPKAEAAGLLSLNVDVHSRTPRLAAMLASADGTLAFAIFPENRSAEVFDLWAANLLIAALPKFGADSTLNCAAARMRLEGGRMQQEELLIDTSTMRVGGRVEADFEERTIDALFAPVAKVPRMFSVATPVRVRGHFEDFGVGVRPKDVAFTVVRLAMSPLVAPLTRIVRGTLDRDGRELCAAAVRGPRQPTSR